MSSSNFFSELRRRNVYKVAAAYAVVGWLLVQVGTQVLPFFEIPNWGIRLIVLLVVIGFPIALVIAWAFELTPDGIKRTEKADAAAQRSRGKSWIYVLVLGAVLSIGLFFLGRYAGLRTSRNSEARSTDTSVSVPPKSIAVLPFESLSDDKSNAYCADGIQDEILTRLSKVADLKVISRTSTQRFKSAPSDLRDIAKQLGVMNILEGSVQKANDQVRVNVQLINATTDAHLWADIYDRKLTDLFAVESEIAKTIADTLQAKLSGSEKAAMTKAPTADTEAYQLYLQGRFFWSKRTAADLRKSIDYFNQAVAKDPGYALAYAAMAQSWLLLPGYDGGAPAECYPQAETAAKKALEIDDALSDAHTALGGIKACYAFDFPAAIKEFHRPIHHNPNDSTAHHWLGNHPLSCLGQLDRSLAEIKKARELDPLSLIINSNIGYTLFLMGRYDEAIAQFRKTLDLDNGFYFAHYNLGMALELKGSIPAAIVEYQKAAAASNDLAPLGYLGHLYGKLGRRAEAQQILERLLDTRKQRYTDAYYPGLVYLGLGNRSEALKYFEQGYKDGDGYNIGPIRTDPLLKELHGDPRFEELANKIVPAREFGLTTTH
jgi:TolB-like protein/Tfp pilus assembly protein PilF